jgi:transposase
MSRKERERITVMQGVKADELNQVQAAELLGVSYRQAKRIWRRYEAEGDACIDCEASRGCGTSR